jgi:hypothetical protein
MNAIYLWLAKRGIQWAIARLEEADSNETTLKKSFRESYRGQSYETVIGDIDVRIRRVERAMLFVKLFIVILSISITGIIVIGILA